MNKLSDYILVVPNAIPNELCDSVMAEYKECDDWIPATVGGEYNRKRSVRRCDNINTSNKSVIDKNPTKRLELDGLLFECASKAIRTYSEAYPECKIQSDFGYVILRYETGGFYIQHTDSFLGAPRAVSCSFALNDDYEGGEFAFFDNTIRYKLKKGDALMFPSNFLFPHEIRPVTSGTRYSIISWFS